MAKEEGPTQEEIEISRTRMPKGSEVFGTVEMMVGGDKLRVRCADDYTRICRIPGRMRKRVWIRINDLILVEPWPTQPNERADVAFRYTPTQANWLRRRNLVKNGL
ncbi:MAG: translation initiation factor eIF-1A [Candidatus Aenigmarchaeota archaeon]|nr:translation initiation factor eIF-1A [Candidatus Aenigmarchaeota archaeon]